MDDVNLAGCMPLYALSCSCPRGTSDWHDRAVTGLGAQIQAYNAANDDSDDEECEWEEVPDEAKDRLKWQGKVS